jgi:hypothetical protein
MQKMIPMSAAILAAFSSQVAIASLQATAYGATSSTYEAYDVQLRTCDFCGYSSITANNTHTNTGTVSAALAASSAAGSFGAVSFDAELNDSKFASAYGYSPASYMIAPVQANATNTAWDTWTITGGTGSGIAQISLTYSSDYYLDTWLTYSLTKETASDSTAIARLFSGMNASGFPSSSTAIAYTGPANSQVLTVDLPFTYGESFQLLSSSSATVLGHSSLESGFSNTSYFAKMNVQLSSITLPSGAILTTAMPVPEPTGAALLTAGLALIVGWSARKKRSQVGATEI